VVSWARVGCTLLVHRLTLFPVQTSNTVVGRRTSDVLSKITCYRRRTNGLPATGARTRAPASVHLGPRTTTANHDAHHDPEPRPRRFQRQVERSGRPRLSLPAMPSGPVLLPGRRLCGREAGRPRRMTERASEQYDDGLGVSPCYTTGGAGAEYSRAHIVSARRRDGRHADRS